MRGKNITIQARDGGSFAGYLATPASGSGPGILVLQEIFGVSAHIRSVVDRWAEEGYVALAPDLFWRLTPGCDLGFSPEDVKTARELGARFDIDQGVRDIGDAIAALRALREFKGRVGTVGYCLGGRLAFLAAARLGVDAAVSYYGTSMDSRLDEVKSVRCPIMLHFGGKDAAVPPETRNKLRAALSAKTMPSFTSMRTPATPSTTTDALKLTICSRRNSHGRDRSVCFVARSVALRLERATGNHSDQEFKYRDTDATMATMTADAYVNHVPTLTGGYGARELIAFTKIIPSRACLRIRSRTDCTDCRFRPGCRRTHIRFTCDFRSTSWCLASPRPGNIEVRSSE